MVVTFFKGHPSEFLLPNQEIIQATSAVLSQPSRPTDADPENRHPLNYGSDSGALLVREELCKFIKARTTNLPEPEMLCLTNGASFGATNALIRCTDSQTHRAFLVSPTYFLLNNMLLDAGFENRLISVVETENGIDLDGLETKLKTFEQELGPVTVSSKPNKFTFRYFLYLVPSFSNPGGITVSLSQRLRLLELARKYDILVLCDEVYEFLNFTGEELPPMLVQLDRESLPEGSVGNVIANYTMSKYLCPGLRFGWQETATSELAFHLSQAGSVKSGGSPAQLSAYICNELLKSGDVNKSIDNLIKTYSERSIQYKAALKEHMPEGTKILGGDGGYFFWMELPPGYNVAKITDDCKQQGIILAPGNHFEVDKDEQGWGERCFRVCFAYHSFAEAEPAIAAWGVIVKNNKL